jgi:hypothetical protein
VLSVSNTPAEIAEKIFLYFEAGAQVVWICDQDGTLEFHFLPPGGPRCFGDLPEFFISRSLLR